MIAIAFRLNSQIVSSNEGLQPKFVSPEGETAAVSSILRFEHAFEGQYKRVNMWIGLWRVSRGGEKVICGA